MISSSVPHITTYLLCQNESIILSDALQKLQHIQIFFFQNYLKKPNIPGKSNIIKREGAAKSCSKVPERVRGRKEDTLSVNKSDRVKMP